MTEYELLDLINGAQQTVVALGVALVSQQTAYVVAIYLIGAKLNRIPLLFLVTAYSFWLVPPIYGFLLAIQRFMTLTNEFHALKGLDAAFADGQHYVNAAVYVFIWLITLTYTMYVRREGA